MRGGLSILIGCLLFLLPIQHVQSAVPYKVKKGDNLYKISKQFHVPVGKIKAANNLKTIRLRPGQRLLIPLDRAKGIEPEVLGEPEEIIDLTPQGPLGRWKSEDERHLLVRIAKSFIGAPYRLGGETVRGLDCSAFVRKIYAIFDLELPRSAREQFKLGKDVARDELLPGDLVFFRTRRHAPYPTHVGIYIGDGKFIHASSMRGNGVKIDSLSSEFFSRSYVGARRIMDLEDLSEAKGGAGKRPENL
jgi:LysM repeat protein